ncbi:PglD-related sugar-binding protein [Chitinophaga agri]|uniref:Acetyltransferase n=1 Tax=Chitinophaga agri TaxID=2703787 RepID=A0A6B9Z7N0_9BACT|nr:acetyltransferase [Chitinophaga agri]QHS58248.1 acetyltransferase [Chitinophaga agri]
MRSCCIYGIGGHAKVLYELVLLNNMHVAGFFDDNSPAGHRFRDLPVERYKQTVFPGNGVIIGVGNNQSRKDIASGLTHPVYHLTHPSAVCSADANINEGTVILSRAIIQADVTIGMHCILNAGCVVDHDAIIEDFVHIAPQAYIGGGAIVGEGAVIGAGAVVMRHASIPAWTVIPPNVVIN